VEREGAEHWRHATLNATVFEPLAWTLFALFTLRAIHEHPRFWLWAGLVAGVALEAKYAIPFFAAPLLFGVVLSPERKALMSLLFSINRW
jgi:hypothetical protein